jgi:hypothetical protein
VAAFCNGGPVATGVNYVSIYLKTRQETLAAKRVTVSHFASILHVSSIGGKTDIHLFLDAELIMFA